MTPLFHPELSALVVRHGSDPIPHVISDWLRDHGEDALADRVVRCAGPGRVEMAIALARLGEVMSPPVKSLVEAFAAVGEAVSGYGKVLVEVMRRLPPH